MVIYETQGVKLFEHAGDVLLTKFTEFFSGLELMEAVLIQLFVIFLIARIFSEISVRLGLLSQVGEIIAGILIANLFIGQFTLAVGMDVAWHATDPSVYHEIFVVIANLGVIFLLFVVGMETRMCDLRAVGRPAVWVATLGTIIPFILGFGLVIGYEHFYPTGNTIPHALFMAAAMVATCVGITARVLTEMGVMETIESRIIIGAAVVDDILAMIVLAVVAGVSGSIAGSGVFNPMDIVYTIVVALAFVGAIMFICLKIPKIADRREGKTQEPAQFQCQDRSWPLKADPFPLAVLTCLGLSALAMHINMAAIIGAFLAGMLFAEFGRGALVDKFRSINAFLVPFFFVYVGMRVEIAGLGAILGLAIGTIVLAIVGKYVAGYFGVLMTQKKRDKESAKIVGIGMVPRGEVGVVVAAYGLTAGFITRDLYTVVVLMSILTALIAPAWLATAYKKKYGDLMEEKA